MRYGAGQLRQLVTLQRPRVERDTMGGASIEHEDATQTWAMVKPLTAREVLNADQNAGEVTHRVVIRYETAPTIGSDWRVLYNGRILEVATPPIDVDERHQWYQLNCKELPRVDE